MSDPWVGFESPTAEAGTEPTTGAGGPFDGELIPSDALPGVGDGAVPNLDEGDVLEAAQPTDPDDDSLIGGYEAAVGPEPDQIPDPDAADGPGPNSPSQADDSGGLLDSLSSGTGILLAGVALAAIMEARD